MKKNEKKNADKPLRVFDGNKRTLVQAALSESCRMNFYKKK